ncbi:hypothetical protein MKW92_005051 [Papaver armeniacum]|nr:hypothetical protein MKW92_005051 [Papaver armeniacum]
MVKQKKQQVISRFFAPKPKPLSPSSSSPPQQNPTSDSPINLSPKVTATVSFSPSKRKTLSSELSSSPLNKPLSSSPHHLSKKPKLSQFQNPSQSLHQKFLEKLLEPITHVTPTCAPQGSRAVVELKSQYPDVVLMIEVGYRYRFFGEDAEIAAKVLGIYAHLDHNFLTASIPTFRLHVHVRRLVNVGHKVDVVKQIETAAIKAHGENKCGPFTRGLSALYTKATLEAAEDMGGGGGGEEEFGSCSNYLICKSEFGKEGGRFDVTIGCVAAEVSTGDGIYGEFNDSVMRNALEALILSLYPAEILIGEPLSKQTEKLLLAYAGPTSNVRVERASRDCSKDGGALAEVMSSYENIDESGSANSEEHTTKSLKQEGQCVGIKEVIAMPELAVQASALTIRHLKKFGMQRILLLGASFRPFSSNTEMTLSANALQQLEVILALNLVPHLLYRDSKLLSYSSLFSVPMPMSTFVYKILSCVEIAQPEVKYILSSVLRTLGKSPDVQRGITRIFHRTATAAKFITVIHAVLFAGKQLKQLREMIIGSPLLRRLILKASSSTLVGNAANLLSVLNKDAASQGDLQNLFNVSSGHFPEVAAASTKVQMEKDKLDLLISQYRKQLRMHNLEFLSVSGSTHLIELPSDMRVPSNWVKINSKKKTIRYHPPEVLKALDQLMLAKEELTVACRAAWDSFLDGVGEYYAEFQAAVQALSALDCLHSLAILSRNKVNNYVRPVFVNEDEPVQIRISSGRHPIICSFVLDSILQDSSVPNDTNLHADEEYCQIITGPNMGGKSCYIRQVALIAIMAQVGSFVPASAAKLHVLDGIYTRICLSDSIQLGRSTFLEELSESSYIISNCTSHSLVILDELGRGTSTHEFLSVPETLLQ